MRAIASKFGFSLKKFYTQEKEQGNWLLRILWLWLITGGVYFVAEGIWRISSNGGWANIAMLPVGGLCGVLIAIMNENPKFKGRKMAVKALYGMAVLVVVEFASGYVMNIMMGMNVWDYSNRPFNFMGQICLAYAALWFMFTPFIIWFDDFIRFKMWNDGERYAWYVNYIKLFARR